MQGKILNFISIKQRQKCWFLLIFKMGKQWCFAHCRNNWRPSFFQKSVCLTIPFLEVEQDSISLAPGALPPLLPTHSSPQCALYLRSKSPCLEFLVLLTLSFYPCPDPILVCPLGKLTFPLSSTPSERWMVPFQQLKTLNVFHLNPGSCSFLPHCPNSYPVPY